MVTYDEFIASKTQDSSGGGLVMSPGDYPFLFDFQEALVSWALRRARAAIFADCGMGKTPMQLAWADAVARATNRPVLILTPLAVAGQTVREGEKFGIACSRVDGETSAARVCVTNYERLHHLDPSQFAGVVCDESSILKSFDGVTKQRVTEFMRKMRFRLLCTATAAPNDYHELGTSSEALGYLGAVDMLNRFFVNDKNNSAMRASGEATKWRFRGHAERPFWRWVCSWARSLRRPSDLGYGDGRFVLPPLVEREHTIEPRRPREGMLFAVDARGLAEEREERRRSLAERCELAASLVNDGDPAVAWCHLNDEGDLLEKLIPDAQQVSGTDSDEEKGAKFAGFADGSIRVLVTKPVIGAWGLNWQHCAHMTTFATHSFEQHYQSVRRFWRYGQTRPVRVDHVLSTGEVNIMRNLRRKAEQADIMFGAIVEHMRDEMGIKRGREFTARVEVAPWL